MKRKIRIVLADDHMIMREGLRSLLGKCKEFQVVAEANNGADAVSLAGEFKPDLVIMDVVMPGLNGIEATRRIVVEVPGVKVVALTMHAVRRYVIEMLKAGANGYLLKERAFEELVDAIHEVVVCGKTCLSPSISDMVIGEYVNNHLNDETSIFSILTPREREVLQLVAEGSSTAQIASIMRISAKTVETHRQHIMDKLNIRGIADLTRYAIREGITQP